MDQLAKQVALDLFAEIARTASGRSVEPADLRIATEFARSSNNASAVHSMVKLVRSEPGVAIESGQLDRDPMLLNLLNGTLDLRNGGLRNRAPEDYCTKVCPVAYDPDATCPHWDRFVREVFQADRELIAYVQRALGYSLTGNVSEQALFVCEGGGANGKSTLLNILLDLLGADYGMKAPTDLLVARAQRSHPTELADLFGKRFVAAIETEADQRLAESLVKELTGGDRIRARRMRQDFWEFSPTHKIWLATNHLPAIRGTDEGIWRRVKVISFAASFPPARRDPGLPEKLRAELPGILNRCLQGCAAWRALGLGEPSPVSAATTMYRRDMDLVGRFLAECCVTSTEGRVRASDLYGAFKEWCDANDEQPEGNKVFAKNLEARGFGKRTSNGVRYLGLELRTRGDAGDPVPAA